MSSMQICDEVLRQWDVTPVESLGGRRNTHWLVERQRCRLVLRCYAEPLGDIRYELDVLQRLRDLGWPVPAAVEAPLHAGGRTWCLFTWLPGACRPRCAEEGRARGRLLAEGY
jgi:aminoglycoside phosphotransferase (APT) family kinase protein